MKLKLAILLFVALAYGSAPAAAQIVGSAQTFAVLGNTTVTNTGDTLISGNLGVSPGTSVTGFPPGILASGTIYTGADAIAVQAQANTQAVYNALVAMPCTTNLTGTDLGGLTLTPGVYCFDVAATLTAGNATLTLDAQNGSGVFVFQIGTTLTTGTNSAVNVINGNAATGVFWQLGTSATLGTGTLFTGNILANTSVTVVSTAKILCGRALALNGAVTMDTNTISNDCISDNFGTGSNDFGSLGFAGAHAYHDFNGDGYSDILFRNTGSPSSTVAMWLMSGSSIASSGTVGTIPNTYSIVGQRDFNGDGKTDILWRDNGGNVYMWFMNGVTMSSSATVGNVSTIWSVKGTGDLDGDGKGDLLWQDTSGNVAVWFMNGSTMTSSVGLGAVSLSTWTILGDTTGDIFWRDTSGDLALWQVTGASVQSSSLGNVPSNWVVSGFGDFDGNGYPDLLFRDSDTGAVAIWFLNSIGQVQSTATVATVPTSTTWSIVDTGDFNRDGMSDILWMDGTGNLAIWFMNGSTIASSAGLGNIGTSWVVQSLNAE